jgi:RHS repeat-associated protein
LGILLFPGKAVNDNIWHYLVGTYAGPGGAIDIYVDGVLWGTTTCANQPTNFGGNGTYAGEIGWKLDHGSNDDFNGAIDEVRFASTALSADWIKTEYNNQNNPTPYITVGPTVSSDLSISSISPTSGAPGTTVTITGTQFGLTKGSSTVTFNGTTASTTTWSDTSIVATVPGSLSPGSASVVVNVVANGTGVTTHSNSATFTVDSVPNISSLSTNSGPIGQSVTISGSNFGSTQGNSTVTFNGMVATVTTWGSGSIGTSVPNGATTGNVVATVQGVPSTGNPTFTVTGADPSISTLCVSSSCVPTGSVQITGSNFTSTQGTVTVGGSNATVTSWGNTSITATLPGGATTGSHVYVTVSGVNSNSVSLALDSIYYFFSDSLSSTRVVTDSQGNICFDADYYPYGKEQDYVNNCIQTYKFTGYERDPETATATSTGNDYAVARHYNSRIFRFLQPDPMGMGAADLTNPQSLNQYAYVGDNPTNVTDPTGMDACDFLGCGGGWGGDSSSCDWDPSCFGGSIGSPVQLPDTFNIGSWSTLGSGMGCDWGCIPCGPSCYGQEDTTNSSGSSIGQEQKKEKKPPKPSNNPSHNAGDNADLYLDTPDQPIVCDPIAKQTATLTIKGPIGLIIAGRKTHE